MLLLGNVTAATPITQGQPLTYSTTFERSSLCDLRMMLLPSRLKCAQPARLRRYNTI